MPGACGCKGEHVADRVGNKPMLTVSTIDLLDNKLIFVGGKTVPLPLRWEPVFLA